MKSGATTSQAGRSSTPQRTVPRRTVLVAAVILGLVVAGFVHECGALRPVHEDAKSGRELARQGGPSPTEQSRVPRPALPPASPAESAPAEPSSTGFVTPETQRKLTQIKVQKYVHEAYPAWLRAHPGQECPHRLIELNAFMDNSDENDAWGRPLKMFCGEDLVAGAKGIEVLSLGRDAEQGTEDDIMARE